jgi:predicted ATP-grasp superfamily ATP-dependent carboligase
LYVVSRYRDRLEPYVALGLPSHEVVQRALDKRCLALQAAAIGIATPDAQVCEGLQAALAAGRKFGYPVLVKPVVAIAEADGRLLRHSSRLAMDETALRAFAQELGACIVQQRVRGSVVSIAGVQTDRGMLGSVLVRHHRTWPPNAGSASFVESMASDPELTERVGALVAAFGWRGLWQLQFIERADGVLHAIDFNPRPYGCMGVAAAAGVPLASIWCASLLGETPRPAIGRAGVRWRMEDSDARNILWRQAILAALPRPRTAHAYFRVRDPLPLLVRAVQLGRLGRRRREDHGSS